MSNYITIGPVRLRVGSKGLASWGYPRLQVGGLQIWAHINSGGVTLASYHPHDSTTWHWSVQIRRNRLTSRRAKWSIWQPSTRRSGQWHDYIRLPFGWEISIGRQDWHLPRQPNQERQS